MKGTPGLCYNLHQCWVELKWMMNSQVIYSVRRVSIQDAEELHRACWPNWSEDTIVELLTRVERLMQQGRGFGVVAFNADSGILGYGQLTVWPRTTEISDLIVVPTHRGRGIGTDM